MGLWSQPDPVPPWEWRNPKLTGDLATATLGNRNSRVYHAGVPQRGEDAGDEPGGVRVGERGRGGGLSAGQGLPSLIGRRGRPRLGIVTTDTSAPVEP